MGYKVAIVGATGNVGREMLSILAERGFPADEVVALASRRSLGTEVSFGDKTLKTKPLDQYDFTGTDICLMSAGGGVSKEWSPKIAAKGCVVIDNSSAFRYDPDVPLIVPEVNADAITGFTKKNIIANPNCSTAQLVVALKPLHDHARIKRIVVSTYQSVSGAGKNGMDELFTQSRAVFVADEIERKTFTKRIAFNVIPHIDVFMEDGSTKEEWKVMVETKKMLDPKIKVTCTAVRVPVFIGHSEAVNIEFENPITAAPGFSLRNVHVLAGVPNIFQAMLASVLPKITGGAPLLSQSLRVDRGEGEIAGPLAAGAAKHGPYDVITIEGAAEVVPEAIVAQLKDGGRIACIFMEGALGVARVGHKSGGAVTWRFAFNASAPVLPGFEKGRGFIL